MQAAQRRLDELVLDVLAPEPTKPGVGVGVGASDSEVSIEMCDEDEFSTTQFVKAFSAPYEKVEVTDEPSAPIRVKRTTYAPVVRTFDPKWFDAPHASADDLPVASRSSWLWLAISISAAAVLVVVLSLAL
jgi:hypothetical protein